MKIEKQKFAELKSRIQKTRKCFDFKKMQTDLERFEKAMQAEDFWQNQQNAKYISQQASDLRSSLDEWKNLEKEMNDVEEMLEILPEEIVPVIESIEARFLPLEKATLFTGEYDAGNAILSIHAGAGGTDAQDWAEMLLRMFLRFIESRNWNVIILEDSRGEEAGIKSVSIEVKGRFAYGHLKSEAGVHRLVRISPFDAEGMRHTSFALVEVIPEIDEVAENSYEIDPRDVRVDTFMASGHGGQSVNTTYSAVRVTHIPTNTVVTCQNERSQQQNKETAMKVLKSRLISRMREEQKEKIDELRGGRQSAEWGSQIRSYVVHPYKLVKDHRTGIETAQVDDVLNGDLQQFIDGYLRDSALNKHN
ncbi:peptide chain release factor 2 [Patescibacteria group bacterium]|nr:peptide chain release factor 2 [Patescibacteria group bacterium]